MEFHPELSWEFVEPLLAKQESILQKMEETGGCPIMFNHFGEYEIVVVDAYRKVPKERVSLCYDKTAWNKRKQNKPRSDVETMVQERETRLLNV